MKVYKVYHAPELDKVGVTSRDLEVRCAEQYIKYYPERLLLATPSLDEASEAEEFYRIKFGYEKDSPLTYKEQMEMKNRTFGLIKKAKCVGINRGIKDKFALRDFLYKGPIRLVTRKVDVTLTEPAQFDFLVETALESQFDFGDYYWNNEMLKAAENITNVTEIPGIQTKDEIVLRLIQKIDKRSLEGQKTYGGTMMEEIEGEEKDFDRFIVDLQEELLDSLLYIESVRECISRKLKDCGGAECQIKKEVL